MARCSSYDPEIQEALGIEMLTSVLLQSGHEVQLSDAMLFSKPEIEIVKEILDFKPRMVGVSLMSDADMESAKAIISQIKKYSMQDMEFVAGGSFVSTEPARVASILPEGTLLIPYEGEKSLLRLVEAIIKSDSLDKVPSLIWKKGEQFHVASTFEFEENLNNLPWPSRIFAREVLARSGVLNVQGSRGCIGGCAYCCMPGLPRPSNHTWRGRSPENIVQELAELNYQYGVAAFNFIDDDFLGPEKYAEDRALALAEAIRLKNLRIGFGVQLRPGSLTLNAIDALVQAGLAYAFVGIENDDPVTMGTWRRSVVGENGWNLIRKLIDRHIEVAAGTILFHPQATLAAVQRFANRLLSEQMLNYRTAVSRLHLLPGSRLYTEYSQAGQIPADVAGPFTPRIADELVQNLFGFLVRILAPLRPVWVQAASLLPGYASRQKAGEGNLNKLSIIRSVLKEMNTWVAEVLITLITDIERHPINLGWMRSAHSKSQRIAFAACEQMQKAELVLDPHQLHEAIHFEGAYD
jgi:hypothetical protein